MGILSYNFHLLSLSPHPLTVLSSSPSQPPSHPSLSLLILSLSSLYVPSPHSLPPPFTVNPTWDTYMEWLKEAFLYLPPYFPPFIPPSISFLTPSLYLPIPLIQPTRRDNPIVREPGDSDGRMGLSLWHFSSSNTGSCQSSCQMEAFLGGRVLVMPEFRSSFYCIKYISLGVWVFLMNIYHKLKMLK